MLVELLGTQAVDQEDDDMARPGKGTAEPVAPLDQPRDAQDVRGAGEQVGQRPDRRALAGRHRECARTAADSAAANSRVRATAAAPSPASETRTEKSSLDVVPV